MSTKLLVILNYPVSAILKKGEYPPGYYNPGDVFDEIHILITVPDTVDLEAIQFTGGKGRVFVHVLPAPTIRQSLGWQPFLLKDWVRRCITLVAEISPNLVRAHNNFIQGYLAAEIKRELGIPYVVSLHGVWDKDDLVTFLQKIIRLFRKKLERYSLENADAVIAVYSPVMRYAREYGAKNVQVIYNAVAARDLPKKNSYSLSSPPKLITINRMNHEKNPENILRAVKDIECTYYLVGDGPYKQRLVNLVKELDIENKVEFIQSMPNNELLEMLAGCDILVSHCDYWGISKSLIESALLGLPIVINRHPVEPIADLDGGWVSLCDNTPQSYRDAIQSLLMDGTEREQLGLNAFTHAQNSFDPVRLKGKTGTIYRKLMIKPKAE